MQYTDITDKTLKAIKRILHDGRSLHPLLNGWIKTDSGYCLTDGYVTIYCDDRLTENECKINTDEVSKTIWKVIESVNNANDNEIYVIDSPFYTIKINTKLVGLCTKFQKTNKFGKSYIIFSGENLDGDRIESSFNSRHLKNAFDAVGCSSEAVLVRREDVLDGKPVLLIKPRLSTMLNRQAIVYPSSDITGGLRAS